MDFSRFLFAVMFYVRKCAVRVAIFTVPTPYYVPIGRRPIEDESINHEAPRRSKPLLHAEIVYKSEVTGSRPTFYARSDSEVAWDPYPIDFAASTRFVETMD